MDVNNSNKKSRLRLSNEQQHAKCNYHLMHSQLSQIELGEWAKQQFGLSKNVSQKTISNILSRKDQMFETYGSGDMQKKSNKAVKMPELDDEIENYIVSMNDRGLPVNRSAVIFYAKVVANRKYKMNEMPKNRQIKFSDGWLTKFLKRIGVKSRHMYGKNNSVDLTSVKIIEELRKIEELLEPYELKNIMNFDETGIYYEQLPTKAISKLLMGGSKKSKKRFTVGLLTN
ncbi:hypothetical protein [Parasitella parasitica]|uniref:HTH CENPB-type domain-containing protein n=1 Tax=Parasitella parasitica TaxID=35722 RepID=A0A0B7NMS6_9FUNG|nr:hypothetical protein [Parasitella parasitica]